MTTTTHRNARTTGLPPLLLAASLLVSSVGCDNNDSTAGPDTTVPYEFRFEGFDDDVGRLFELRAIDFWTEVELDRVRLEAIPGPDFAVTIHLEDEVDAVLLHYHADHDGSGGYDAPPTDHAWEVGMLDLHRPFGEALEHDWAMFDIDWP